MSKIKVLIVDDSAVIRQIVKEILEEDPQIEVVGVASDCDFAEKKISKLKPDVITLDVEMPGTNGIEFLEKLMHSNPMPVVMLSSVTSNNASHTLKALELGAFDFITKPKINVAQGIDEIKQEIILKVKAAAQAKIKKRTISLSELYVEPKRSVDEVISPIKALSSNRGIPSENVIVLGASTGGTVAIADLLQLMPLSSPGIVIVQHMPEKFTKAYADRINGEVDIEVREAINGDRVHKGLALIAPGGKHMLLQSDSSGFYVQVKDGPPVNRHKPSVDVLFRSAANAAGKKAIGVILTGMGDDGARGMLEMRQAGSYNIAQSRESCVVFGMPRAAIELNAVNRAIPLELMPAEILKYAS